MQIALASDHAGFALKSELVDALKREGYVVIDRGPSSEDPVDYPPYAESVANDVVNGSADFGVVVCGSGVGVAIAANKVHGIRAVNAHDPDEAVMARRHNNANVVTLAGRRLSVDEALLTVREFVSTDFEGGRHARRVDLIAEIERHEQ